MRKLLILGYKKRASLLHRTATTRYRCFDQDLTEFSGSWSCRTYPTAKVQLFFISHNIHIFLSQKSFALVDAIKYLCGSCKKNCTMKKCIFNRFHVAIIALFMLIAPFVGYSQQMYNSSGSLIGRYENGRIYDRSGSYIGKADGDRFYNRSGSYMGYVSGERFYNSYGSYEGYGRNGQYYDRSGSLIGRISGGYIYNRSGSQIGRVSNVPQTIAAAIYLYGIFSL